jgi:hypothetical protein
MDCYALQWGSTAFVRKGDGMLYHWTEANEEWHVHEFQTNFHTTDAIQDDQETECDALNNFYADPPN